jgi:hypothetical protein
MADAGRESGVLSDARRALATRGWVRFAADPAVLDWVAAALPAARAAVADPANAGWLRCGGTWFAGVDVLANDAQGRIGQGPPLAGAAVDLARDLPGGGDIAWHRGQVSVVYPGYPRPMSGESAAAFRYRRDRDAAHLDGVLPIGPDRRRMIREPHAFVLGLPLTECDAGASPMVVWEGSPALIRTHLARALDGVAEADRPNTDITEAYHAARRAAFESCPRVVLRAKPGEAYLVHRLALHGVAPWAKGAKAPPEGRMIAYFRPELSLGRVDDWLTQP